MKTPILLMAALLILLMNACDRPLFGPNLPRETQEGANTFGCRVDGEVWLPNNPVFPYISRGASYGYGSIRGTVRVFANNEDRVDGFDFYLEKLVFGPSRFVLSDTLQNPLVGYQKNGEIYWAQNGELAITHLDTTQAGFISGTFWFKAVNRTDSTDTIHLTDGRFDVRF
ncbi:MAG: hypothetical protein SF053_05035 [Bacteroidia bacterium]|nr:hypothetical protein [Bacteroidia bacterium]